MIIIHATKQQLIISIQFSNNHY